MTTIHSDRGPLLPLLKAARVIPVITLERVEDAVPLARALVLGGIRTLEVTLRTAAALEAAQAIMAEVPEAIVGLGTVLGAADLVRARAVGARFALSPGATPELLDAAASNGLPFVPGIATASELMAVLARGFDIFKFFPAREAGASRRCGRLPARSRRRGSSRPAASMRATPPTGLPRPMWRRWAAPGCVPRPKSVPETGQRSSKIKVLVWLMSRNCLQGLAAKGIGNCETPH